MRTSITRALLGVCIGYFGNVYATESLDLEPCINGAVSQTGRYESQALEDRWMKAVSAESRRQASH
jgi:hypothetical protein